MKIYIVTRESGSYDDYLSDICNVTLDYKRACIFIARLLLYGLASWYDTFSIQVWEDEENISNDLFYDLNKENYIERLELTDDDIVEIYKIN